MIETTQDYLEETVGGCFLDDLLGEIGHPPESDIQVFIGDDGDTVVAQWGEKTFSRSMSEYDRACQINGIPADWEDVS